MNATATPRRTLRSRIRSLFAARPDPVDEYLMGLEEAIADAAKHVPPPEIDDISSDYGMWAYMKLMVDHYWQAAQHGQPTRLFLFGIGYAARSFYERSYLMDIGTFEDHAADTRRKCRKHVGGPSRFATHYDGYGCFSSLMYLMQKGIADENFDLVAETLLGLYVAVVEVAEQVPDRS
jgi:hypothetical protein